MLFWTFTSKSEVFASFYFKSFVSKVIFSISGKRFQLCKLVKHTKIFFSNSFSIVASLLRLKLKKLSKAAINLISEAVVKQKNVEWILSP